MWIDRQSEVKEKGNQQDRFPGLQKESIYNLLALIQEDH